MSHHKYNITTAAKLSLQVAPKMFHRHSLLKNDSIHIDYLRWFCPHQYYMSKMQCSQAVNGCKLMSSYISILTVSRSSCSCSQDSIKHHICYKWLEKIKCKNWKKRYLLDWKDPFALLYANSSMSGRPHSCIDEADKDINSTSLCIIIHSFSIKQDSKLIIGFNHTSLIL